MSQLWPRDLLANGRPPYVTSIAGLMGDDCDEVAKADIEEMAETVDAGFDRDALAAQLRPIRDVRKYGGVGAPAGRVLRDVVGEPRGD